VISIGIILYICLTIIDYANWRYLALTIAVQIFFALRGGAWLHSVIPPMLQEGSPPSDAELASASTGIFSLQGLSSLSVSLQEEWDVAIENLAFGCTYGKRNCITSAMYDGKITLRKIVSLVGEKLGQGVLVCR